MMARIQITDPVIRNDAPVLMHGHTCSMGIHIPGVCRHPGSKRDPYIHLAKRRAKNKVTRNSRRMNRR